MNAPAPPPLPPIRRLSEAAVNRIAAGEVIERPASAVKELVENAIDAGASRIEVRIQDGGRTLIRVTDDGCGIPEEALALALTRHATSKTDGDLSDIRTMGFRGEALASMAASGRLEIASRPRGHGGARIAAEGTRTEGPVPTALPHGTAVTLTGLFSATPARLKFLRTDRAEAQAVAAWIRRIALAHPRLSITLTDHATGREVVSAPAERGTPEAMARARARRLLSPEFEENAIWIETERDGHALTGLAALPTYDRGAASQQHLFVGRRAVTDGMLQGALRGAYRDLLPKGRHAAAVLFVDCEGRDVDVNVHPAKTEVRFRRPDAARALIVSGVRRALDGAGHRAATTLRAPVMDAARPYAAPPPAQQSGFAEAQAPMARRNEEAEAPAKGPLGAARAQLHGNWIVSQTDTGMVIVDAHAAHERLVLERLKRERAAGPVPSQALLIPEIVELPAGQAETALDQAEAFEALGLAIEPFGPGAVAVRAVPLALSGASPAALLRDALDAAGSDGLEARLDAVLASVACHGSVRTGRALSGPEMDALLREMEATPGSGQCNHGRPTYVELPLKDIERLFGR